MVSTVNKLLAISDNASEPGLLLGNIQCGKTDTFECIVGLAFDRGIDLTVVLTKGTNALVKQTKARMEKDYDHFMETTKISDTPVIEIKDIMEDVSRRDGLSRKLVDDHKQILVVKKEKKNLERLINLFTTINPWLRDKKVLVVDDEADFASRNYRYARLECKYDDSGDPAFQKREKELSEISKQIDDFRKLPSFCRYLQVTATPYALYLQPDGMIHLKDRKAQAWRPRFTSEVPIHSRYVGGKQYFEESENPSSMYSHLFHPLEPACLSTLLHRNNQYISRGGVNSKNLLGLTEALLSYFMAAAIRSLQCRAQGERYQSSALFHLAVAKTKQVWQKDVIDTIINQIKQHFAGTSDKYAILDAKAKMFYDDFAESNRKAREGGRITVELPALNEVREEVYRILDQADYTVSVVNSDEEVIKMLNKDGELKLKTTANIFIGGNILDRGITVQQMLCFFYGRNPKRFQMDTVVQHARYYGARTPEDMAVTRLHTTPDIYGQLKRIYEIDEEIRQSVRRSMEAEDYEMPFIGYDKNQRPCSPSKTLVSDLMPIKGGKRFLPMGMQTRSAKEVNPVNAEIETLIEKAPGWPDQDEMGFFEMDVRRANKILRKIAKTYLYSADAENIDRAGDMEEVRQALRYCTDQADGKILVWVRSDREMSRERMSGGWSDTPYSGQELPYIQAKTETRPVLVLLKQKGAKAQGWRDTPFYWPVLFSQQELKSVLCAPSQKSDHYTQVYDMSELTKGIPEDEILPLTFIGDLVSRFGEVGAEYATVEDAPIETRSLRDTNEGTYLEKAFGLCELAYNPEVNPEAIKNKAAGVYTYNGGKFPFVLRPYKYLKLVSGGNSANPQGILLELFPREEWIVEAFQDADDKGWMHDFIDPSKILYKKEDGELLPDGSVQPLDLDNLCQWVIRYPVKRVLRYMAPFDHEEPSDMEDTEDDGDEPMTEDNYDFEPEDTDPGEADY